MVPGSGRGFRHFLNPCAECVHYDFFLVVSVKLCCDLSIKIFLLCLLFLSYFLISRCCCHILSLFWAGSCSVVALFVSFTVDFMKLYSKIAWACTLAFIRPGRIGSSFSISQLMLLSSQLGPHVKEFIFPHACVFGLAPLLTQIIERWFGKLLLFPEESM